MFRSRDRPPRNFFPPAGVTYQTLATGGNTSYAITTTGAVYAWGRSTVGQVGDGTRKTAEEPVSVTSGAVTQAPGSGEPTGDRQALHRT